MTAFLIADIKVTDDKWVPEYAASIRGHVAGTRRQISVTPAAM